MSTELCFGCSFSRNAELPNRFHLLSAVFHFHFFVVELVPRCGPLLRLASPVDDLSGMSEHAASEVGRRIRLEPNDVVENSKPVLEQRHSNAWMHMKSSGDPNGSGWLQYPEALFGPCQVELKVPFNSSATVPVAFVYWNHLSGYACNAVV